MDKQTTPKIPIKNTFPALREQKKGRKIAPRKAGATKTQNKKTKKI